MSTHTAKLTQSEIDQDIEYTRNDILNLEKVVDGLADFILRSGGEDRGQFKLDLFKYRAILVEAEQLLALILKTRETL